MELANLTVFATAYEEVKRVHSLKKSLIHFLILILRSVEIL